MRRFLFAMPFLAVPLAAAACGGGKSASSPTTVALSDDPLTAVKGAANKTVDAGSEHATLAGHVVASGQAIVFKGSGDFDTKKDLGSMSVDLSAGGINTTVDEVSDGTTIYVKSELITAMLPAGKEWVKIDLTKVAPSQGVNIPSILAQDPASALTHLQGIRGVRKVGETQVNGASLTHYRGRINLSALTGGKTTGTGRYDVWIGDDGYVHRVKALVTNGGTTSTVTSELSAFGDPVSIDVPSAAETFDGSTAMIPGLGG